MFIRIQESSRFFYIHINSFKIIPPPEWSPNSRNIPNDFELNTVVKQSADELKSGIFDLFTNDVKKMPYGEFIKLVEAETKNYFDGRKLSIEEIENIYWQNITNDRHYAIDNELSLFGEDTITWNLDRFTDVESNIHFKKPHNLVEVSKNM